MPSPSSVAEEWEFSPQPSSSRDARQVVARVLERLGLEELITSVSLVVSELATNAVLHARTAFSVRLRITGGVARIEVEDAAGGRPVMRHFSNQATSGRGLRLVDGLSRAWGVTAGRGGAGKVVWAEIVGDHPGGLAAFDIDAVDEL